MIVRDGTSDRAVFNQVFDQQIYRAECPVEPVTILDLGAYTGLSTRYFIDRYPDATVIAVEPDPVSASILRKNAPEAEIHEVAAWNERGTCDLRAPTGGAWRSTVSPEVGGRVVHEVEARTVDGILDDRLPEIVKMDIEGGEVEVLEEGGAWLDYVRLIFFEQHDRFRPGCSDALRDALDRTGRDHEWVPNGGSNVLVRVA